mmetsp:Transcript_129729/g.307764  ORF Transcript_129729/g.307764 Transcript_129729/m.307764 type:complete len:208 (-) Transcript_129729:387-1010(-)
MRHLPIEHVLNLLERRERQHCSPATRQRGARLCGMLARQRAGQAQVHPPRRWRALRATCIWASVEKAHRSIAGAIVLLLRWPPEIRIDGWRSPGVAMDIVALTPRSPGARRRPARIAHFEDLGLWEQPKEAGAIQHGALALHGELFLIPNLEAQRPGLDEEERAALSKQKRLPRSNVPPLALPQQRLQELGSSVLEETVLPQGLQQL